MHQVTYAGEVFLTGDAIASALLEVVAALGVAADTRVIDLPALNGESRVKAVISIVVGPSSEIIAMHVDWDGEELVDDEAVDALNRVARSLNPVLRPVQGDAPIATDTRDDFSDI